MKNNFSERRIRKTIYSIQTAFLELLKLKNLDEITVTELTTCADIHRGTFYLHYKDIYDLFNNIEESLLEEFQSITDLYFDSGKPNLEAALNKLFEYYYNNSNIFKAVLSSPKSSFFDKMLSMRRPRCFREWRAKYSSGREDNYLYYFESVASAIISLVCLWYKNGCDKSPKEIAEIANDIMDYYGYLHI